MDPSHAGHSGTLLKGLIFNSATLRWGLGHIGVLGSLRHLPVPTEVAKHGMIGPTAEKHVKATLCFADQGNKALFYFILTLVDMGKARFSNRRGWLSRDDAKDPNQRPKLADSFNNVQQIFCTEVKPEK
ncbi:hypothetical protein LX36DRAFT_750741 [Colletotrichum falcatum]|nr:hypothetical protein LX36DRAFT_750741 [Colletotrichum falcatum]